MFIGSGWSLVVVSALFLLSASVALKAQSNFVSHEADTWYFGAQAGISFAGGGDPVAINNSAMRQHEGSAVISDRVTGDLLFYTNGETVWNSDHTVMDGGTGLLGHSTSTQTALIVPRPGTDREYYLFTVGAGTYVNGNNNGFRYTEVDLTQNGGLGAVTSRNNLLLQKSAEKLTATRHCNGRDYWVLVHGWENAASTRFFAYLVTPDGIQAPVTSSLGTAYRNGNDLQGVFKFSPDGSLLAVTSSGPQTLEFFEFDRKTGVVSNQRLITTGSNFYGIEFSRSGSYLYTTTLPAGTASVLSQFDLSSGDPATIRGTAVELYRNGRSWPGAQLQMGPNGKIYASFFREDHLGVINEPELPGIAANYVSAGVDLNGARTEYGLPNFIQANLFYEQNESAADALLNFPCEEIPAECPQIDTARFAIGDFRTQAVGDTLDISVNLLQVTRTQPVSTFRIEVRFPKDVLLPLTPTPTELVSGGILEPWDLIDLEVLPGRVMATFNDPTPDFIPTSGKLINLRFRSFFGAPSVEGAPLSLSIVSDLDSCTLTRVKDGKVSIDSICAASHRLIELASGFRYSLEPIQWNRSASTLEFSLVTAREGTTRIELIDLQGEKVCTLHNTSLLPGSHKLTFDGSSLESGVYLCRIQSGPWATIRRLLLTQ